MKCPKCDNELRPSKKDPDYGLCDFCKKRYKLPDEDENEERTEVYEPYGSASETGKWYQKTVWIIVLLILFFPVGIYLMWKYTNWGKVVKVLVTGFIALCAIIYAAGIGQLGKATNVANEAKVAETEETEEVKEEEPEEVEEKTVSEQIEEIANSDSDTLTKAQGIATLIFGEAVVEYDTERNMVITTIQKNTIDSLTLNRYRESSYSQMTSYMERLYGDGTDFNFVFNSTTNDVNGNEVNVTTISATFTNASISEINWENFDYKNLPAKAEMFNIREELQ